MTICNTPPDAAALNRDGRETLMSRLTAPVIVKNQAQGGLRHMKSGPQSAHYAVVGGLGFCVDLGAT